MKVHLLLCLAATVAPTCLAIRVVKRSNALSLNGDINCKQEQLSKYGGNETCEPTGNACVVGCHSCSSFCFPCSNYHLLLGCDAHDVPADVAQQCSNLAASCNAAFGPECAGEGAIDNCLSWKGICVAYTANGTSTESCPNPDPQQGFGTKGLDTSTVVWVLVAAAPSAVAVLLVTIGLYLRSLRRLPVRDVPRMNERLRVRLDTMEAQEGEVFAVRQRDLEDIMSQVIEEENEDSFDPHNVNNRPKPDKNDDNNPEDPEDPDDHGEPEDPSDMIGGDMIGGVE